MPRYPNENIILIEICHQILVVNTICANAKMVGISFPIRVGAYSFASCSNAKKLLKVFNERYKFESYEVIRLKFDLFNYIKDRL